MQPSQSADDDDSDSCQLIMVEDDAVDGAGNNDDGIADATAEHSPENDEDDDDVENDDKNDKDYVPGNSQKNIKSSKTDLDEKNDDLLSDAPLISRTGPLFNCIGCHKKFKQIKVAVAHQKNPMSCEFCHRIFCNSIVLGKHMWKTHPTGEGGEIFKCTNCSQTFATKSEFDRHEDQHIITENSNDFNYCEICDLNIPNKSVYARHIQKHQKEVFKCTICYKGFTNAHLLENHIARLCDSEAAHQCQLCHKKIMSALYFRYHMNKHNGETPYWCDTCQKSFIMPCVKHRKRRRTGDE